MPAIGTRAADARTRGLRLVGLAIALLFMASAGAAWSNPVEAKDWTPQIQATRRAQIYWESVMRAADAELRSLKKTKRQAQRKLKRVETNRDIAIQKRVAAKRRLKDTKATLVDTRHQLETAATASMPYLDLAAAVARHDVAAAVTPLVPAAALQAPVVPAHVTTPDPVAHPPIIEASPLVAASSEWTRPDAGNGVDERALATLEKQAKKAKRDFKTAKRNFRKAKRKARRAARNTHSAKVRVASLKAAESGAFARRESAERSLGAWVLAMTKYGRIRATKKSDARPGVKSSFAWPVRGRISQYFHSGHDGIDIVRYRGAPVRSAAFGVVTYVGWNPWDQHRRAFMVVVTHAGGFETLYGHLLPKRIVRVGEEVKKGQVVGYMGSTGNSTGPHLHLELRRGRTTVNPMGFL